ncbi:M23 family metallopeptidase [Cytophagaceae bacterium DM2B3-1]|uniref:M23 family metallopeptidase n=1 Tax=Xanthocytophaga flava TaxID=3048013 RepID=A0ABT7CJ57_9BACT|nr:M23 family metallopeptidase [Xanthocytophaga flavus]MDJ1493772.1 M23 family metallopeptidase [Xanthocytophaga flavus]
MLTFLNTLKNRIFVKKTLSAPLLYLFSGILCLTILSPTQAQTSYPKGYFMFPIKPGQKNLLAGNMGELRPDHFHAGLDIKTDGKEGLPVYAAADGYISRIKVTRKGYGNGLYITHPNGYVTVYGHLKQYNAIIGQYLKTHQYDQQTFEIDLLLDSTQIRVKRGEVVALSGNTGGSGGPHLHFEIRDTKDNVLNPLNFGFSEITDKISPIISRLALRTLSIQGRVDGEYGRLEYIPQRQPNGNYIIHKPVYGYGDLGLELLANDLSDGTSNRNGISCIEVQLDNQVIFSHHLESFSFEQTQYINTHIAYEKYRLSGERYQRCYLTDGNALTTYKTDENKGRIHIMDTQPHLVRVSVWDAYQNVTRLNFTIQGNPYNPSIPAFKSATNTAQVQQQLFENTLCLWVNNPLAGAQKATFYTGKDSVQVPSAYIKKGEVVYLWDVRKALPDSVQIGNHTEPFYFKSLVPSNVNHLYEGDSVSILFNESSLFDTLYLETRQQGNIYQIGRMVVPLRDYIDVRLKANVPSTQKTKTSVYLLRGRTPSYQGGTWIDNSLSFRTKDLGTFTLMADTIAPVAKCIIKNREQIVCKVSDNLSGIGNYRAYINGRWLLMQYDYKTGLLWSDRPQDMPMLQGDFILEVEDNVQNTIKLEMKIP